MALWSPERIAEINVESGEIPFGSALAKRSTLPL
jgi:hypothetical protein